MKPILRQLAAILHRERAGLHSKVSIGATPAALALFMGCALGLTGAHAQQPAALPASAAASATAPPASAAAPPASAAAPPASAAAAAWIRVPRLAGRLAAKDLGLVINTADAYSVAVGEFYASQRQLAPSQVLRIELPLRATLTAAEFKDLSDRIDAHFGAATQALALAWTMPYAVSCNSITGALALGVDEGLCAQSCAPSRVSPYFNSGTLRPHADLKMRPSMLLAARDVDTAKALILRGVAADHSLGLRGAPPANAYFVTTPDRVRSVRAGLFPPPGLNAAAGIDVRVEATAALVGPQRVLLYITGLSRVDRLDTVQWLPGALADHLTSFGGQLDEKGGQMSVLSWIHSGATASYGTVSEPCSHVQKFPHPQVLLLNYAQGSTALEAYWRSVAWPQQGLFIGEPLAAPFARR